MPKLGDLLAWIDPGRLRPLGAAGARRDVRGVALAEDLGEVEHAPGGSLVLLTRTASADAATYRFDVAVRRGAERGVAALALADPHDRDLSRSARAAAQRADLALLGYGAHEDLAELAASLGALLRGEPERAVEAAAAGLRALDRAREEAAGVAATVAAVGQALPGTALAEPTPGLLGEPIEVEGIREAWLVAPEAGPVQTLLLRAAAADVAAAMGRARRAQDAPVRSRSELLTELLATEPGRDGSLVRRARALGLAVDAWHTVTLVRFEEGDPDDPVRAEELRRAVEQVALATARAVHGTWHVARSEGAVVLLRTSDTQPSPRDPGARTAAASVLAALHDRFPPLSPRAGVGGAHLGPAGLRASTAEARAALAAARPGEPVGVFDASGLGAMLAEWYATDSARRSVSTLLEPL
ncbi:MAG: hypothetical protein ACM3OO_07985 [Planctomycetaceae bacterium]